VAGYKFPDAYLGSWFPIFTATPLLVAVSVVALARRSDGSMASQRVFAAIAILSLCSLVQFPFAVAIYFCYVAPLIVIAVLPFVNLLPKSTRVSAWSVAIYLLMFAVLRFSLIWVPPLRSSLNTTRGKILVTSVDAAVYNQVIALVQQHGQGDFIYATPDCPELYFLTGKQNPTRSLFEFLDNQEQRSWQISSAMQSEGIKLVVINRSPGFSEIPPQRLAELRSLFPYSSSVGKFDVRWR
jgi:hypothetical protein